MKKNIFMTNHAFVRRVTSLLMLVVFSATTILMPAKASAQSVGIPGVNLPAVGTMLGLSESFQPVIIRGMTVYPDNPLKFDFIVNTGDNNLKGQALEKESQKLIKYFLASLTTPENEFWVNLSPYESGRIIPEALGTTEMGRDMLAQDYILKQLTASLLYPEKDLGNKFWQRVHEKAKKLYGVSEIPVDTFNKVWIMPDKASVYENDNRVFVVERHLKVMLAEDYEAMQKTLDAGRSTLEKTTSVQRPSSSVSGQPRPDGFGIPSDVASSVIRELIIPEIEKEVNEGENFAVVRQIYNSMILATWYKKRLKESLLGQVYVNQNKVKGIDLADRETKQKIYEQYLAAFKKGVYNYIKEDVDALTKEPLPRKYFSGGLVGVASENLGVFSGSLDGQPKIVSAAVTEPLTDKGSDVVVSSSLVENATQAVVAAATPIKSALTAIGTNVSFPIPKSPFMDTKLYQLTGAASTWSVSMGGIMERIQGFGLGAETWAMQAADFATYHPGTVLLGAIAFYAVASFDPIGYFRNKVDFNLRQANALKDDDQKRYLYLDRIVARGQEVVPDLLNQFQQPDASEAKVRDIAYVLGKLKVAQVVEPLISKFSQNIAVDEIVVALGEIGGQKASELLAQQLLEEGSFRSIAVAEGLVKLGVDRGKEFLLEMLKSTNIKLRSAARVALSRLEINDAPAVKIYDEVYQRLQAVVSPENITLQYNFASEFSAAYAIALSGGDFYVTYVPEATVLRPVKENSSLNADYEKVIVPAKLVIVKEGNKSSPSSASSGIIAKATIALGRKGFKSTIPSLLKLLGHEDEKIRSEAEEVLGKLGATKEQKVDAYIEQLSEYSGKRNAIQKLGELGNLEDKRIIKALYSTLLVSPSYYLEIGHVFQKWGDGRLLELAEKLKARWGIYSNIRAFSFWLEGYDMLEYEKVTYEKVSGYIIMDAVGGWNFIETGRITVDHRDDDEGISFDTWVSYIKHEERVVEKGDPLPQSDLRDAIRNASKSDILMQSQPTQQQQSLHLGGNGQIQNLSAKDNTPAASAPVGGIDFNSAALDLQIKRDGNGVPLPLPQQTIQNMKIDGFYPVIINIAPVNIPMLLGQKTQKEPQQLSALR